MAKKLELVGKRFGNLTVISRAENNPKGNTQWNCKCDCGGEKVVLGYDLTHGRTTTCGCKQYLVGKPSSKRISLVGQRFGKLTVVSLNEEKSKNGILVWNCLCDCGNSFTARGGNLKTGKATHCGCSPQRHANNFIDLTGRKYGRLTVERESEMVNGKVMWECVCDCGNRKTVSGNNLRSGHTTSCGCVLDETRRVLHKKRTGVRTISGKKTDELRYALYNKWHAMKSRCMPYYHQHEHYYDKGVTVCDEWEEFEPFYQWGIENGFQIGLTLDRIDVNGIYSPSNCRWVTIKVQQNNRTDNVYVTIDGETKTLKMWCEQFGLDYGMVKARRSRGWPQERWFEPPHINQYQ